MLKDLNLGIENAVQFATALLAITGGFVVKPEMFGRCGEQTIFIAGNLVLYFYVLISIGTMLMTLFFSKKGHFKYWITATLIVAALFILMMIKYNRDISTRTFLLSNSRNESTRVIKGDDYKTSLKETCDLLKTEIAVTEMQVIRECADVNGPCDLSNVWPLDQIDANASTLFKDYSLSVVLVGISLICGVQSIKCRRKGSELAQ